MPFVAQDDLILSIPAEINFIQGNSQSYDLFLYKDFFGNPLNLSQPTSIQVAIWNASTKLLQYNSPFNSGTSGELIRDTENNTGKITFNVTVEQSNYVTVGELFVEVTVIYEDYYPTAKTYVFDKLAIGDVIDNGSGGGGDPTPITVKQPVINPTFVVEHVDNNLPTINGRMSLDNTDPATTTRITFKNLDSNLVRLKNLENFLQNRITADTMNGNITLYDTEDSNLYSIYKINSWERIDLVVGDGDEGDTDAIRLDVTYESSSVGPGVTKTAWEVGMELSYELDALGTINSVQAENGVLTNVDKGLNPTQATTSDGDRTGIFITYTPYKDSYVNVKVNGIGIELGDGTKDKDAYFSGNGGTDAVALADIRAGDELIWNGSIARFELSPLDEIDLIYEASVNDL